MAGSQNLSMQNPNCDGAGPCDGGEVRVMPRMSGDGNDILCIRCHGREARFRQRQFKVKLNGPSMIWWDLKIYNPEPSIPGEHDVVIQAIEGREDGDEFLS